MVEKVGWIIGGLIAFVFVAVIVFILFYKVYNEADLYLLQRAPQALVLEAAIQCAYYRCVSGCESPQTADTSVFPCRSEFCNAKWTDNGQADGKICGDSAKAHPVTAAVNSVGGERITLGDMQGLTAGQLPIDSISIGGAGIFPSCTPIDENKYTEVVLNDSDVSLSQQDSSCQASVCVLQAVVKQNPAYYIWTDDVSNLISQNAYSTIVCTTNPQISTCSQSSDCCNAYPGQIVYCTSSGTCANTPSMTECVATDAGQCYQCPSSSGSGTG